MKINIKDTEKIDKALEAFRLDLPNGNFEEWHYSIRNHIHHLNSALNKNDRVGVEILLNSYVGKIPKLKKGFEYKIAIFEFFPSGLYLIGLQASTCWKQTTLWRTETILPEDKIHVIKEKLYKDWFW